MKLSLKLTTLLAPVFAIIVAFGPMPNPKYAVSVVIENGESGGSVAGPVAIAVLNNLFKE